MQYFESGFQLFNFSVLADLFVLFNSLFVCIIWRNFILNISLSNFTNINQYFNGNEWIRLMSLLIINNVATYLW